MKVYKIMVKPYMTKKSSPSFDFMLKWNNDNPMPLRTMVGHIIKETKGMVRMKLHGDILEEQTQYCMKCGRPINNPVSKFFGMGPECGGHNYTNPFDTKDELKQAVENYRQELHNITWEGWIIKSAITEQLLISDDGVEEVIEQPVQEKVKGLKVVIKDKVDDTIPDSQSAFVSFEYDYSIVQAVRNLAFRHYNKEDKTWEIRVSDIETLREALPDRTFDIDRSQEVTHKAPKANLENFEFITNPFEHQVEGFNYGLEHKSFLLADEQGLGKTKQVIDIAVAKKQLYGYEHCLIVCGVNGLKWNWQNEIKVHSNEEGYILGTRFRKTTHRAYIGSSKDKLTDLYNLDSKPYFIITNIETLRDSEIVATLKELCTNNTINMMAVDEIHKAKNSSSQQGKGLLKLCPETRIAMSGTPLMNNPLDLYTPLKWLGYEPHSFYSFKNHYCVLGGYGGYEIVGYKNLYHLQTMLDSIMLRRLKKDVLDLPDKMYIDEYVEMNSKQKAVYTEAMSWVKENIDKVKISPNPLAQLIRLRQATGSTDILSTSIHESAKLDRLEELVEECVANNDKVIIFSNWTDMTDIVLKRLEKYNPAIITGQTKDREAQKEKFMADDNCKCIIGTIGAMGTGLTLTAATTVIFLDEPWNRANKEQAEDRAHRIGTKGNVTIITLICKDTIDERINELVYNKGKMSDMLIDGSVDFNRPEVVDYLIN